MNSLTSIKKRLIIIVLVLVLIAGAAVAYVATNRVDAYGKWTVLSPNVIILLDNEGSFYSEGGDYRMDTERIIAFENWLEANGFTRDQDIDTNADEAYFRGSYRGSLPVSVKIESRATPETAQIGLLYRGSFFKWGYQKRKKLVQTFSNEIARQFENETF